MTANTAKDMKIEENTEAESPGSLPDLVENTQISKNMKAEKLAYILEMLEELRKLSDTLDERMVAYLIEMAILETNTAINVQEFGTEIGDRSRKNRDAL